MPEGFDYLTLVQTARTDWQSTADQAVSLGFTGTEPVSLYVAYDALAVAVPTWLRAGWTRLAQGIEVSEELLVLTRLLGSAPCALAPLERTLENGAMLTRLLVADGAGFVHVLDPRELRRLVEHDPAAGADEVELAHLPVGQGACHIALLLDYRHPDWAVARSLAYVACSEAGQVAVIDLDELERLVVGDPAVTVQDVVRTIDVGRGVTAVSLLPDRHEAQALNLLDRSITTIDLGANRPVETRPAALPHERVAGELDRVRSAGIRARVVFGDA